MAGMAWTIVLATLILFMLIADDLTDPTRGLRMITYGLVFLIMAAVFMVKNWIEQAELKVREKLLELEYQLAEVSEGLRKK